MKPKSTSTNSKSSTNQWEPTLSLADHKAPKAKAIKNVRAEDERLHDIEVAAYFLSEKRGFSPGFELDDWLTAEKGVANGKSIGIV